MKAQVEIHPRRRTLWSAHPLPPETGAPACGDRDPRSCLLRFSERRRALRTPGQPTDPPPRHGLATLHPPSPRASLPFNLHSLRPAVQSKRLLSPMLAASR
jgi:hypothetical protein